MKQKTAMIETFNHLEDWLSSGKDVYQWIYLYKDIYIEKEKEHIINAFRNGFMNYKNSEEYFNSTFKQD